MRFLLAPPTLYFTMNAMFFLKTAAYVTLLISLFLVYSLLLNITDAHVSPPFMVFWTARCESSCSDTVRGPYSNLSSEEVW